MKMIDLGCKANIDELTILGVVIEIQYGGMQFSTLNVSFSLISN